MIRYANQGPEVARNTVESKANGEYPAFLLSDDSLWIRADQVEKKQESNLFAGYCADGIRTGT